MKTHTPFRFFACLALVLLGAVLWTPNACAGSFSKFVGNYSGTAKIVYGGVTYSTSADAVFKMVSNNKVGRFSLSGSNSKSLKILLLLKTGSSCVVKLQAGSQLSVQADGTYQRDSSKEVSLIFATVIENVAVGGPGTLEMLSNTKIRLSGKMTGVSSLGKTVTVQYRYQGKKTTN
jgi:hypothetical protein